MITITEMDHIVLNVADVDRSLHFYGDLLGLELLRVEEFRAGKVGFPSVRITADTIIDLSPIKPAGGQAPPAPEARLENLAHFCLVTDAPDLTTVRDELAAAGFPSHIGPVDRWGARGTALSIYLKDPDGNTVEIRTYKR
jgi:catechol 2,3-dioxygenase-like lactoylglutathione lyase family enzyme